MFFFLLKLLLFCVITIAEGFLLALLLQELYQSRSIEPLREEFRPAPDETFYPTETSSVENFQEPVSLPNPQKPEELEEPIIPTVAEPFPKSPSESRHYNSDDFDESLLPKGFKVDSVFENMLDAGASTDAFEEIPEMIPTDSNVDSFSGPNVFEEEENADFGEESFSFESGPLSPIEMDESEKVGETTSDSDQTADVLALAFELSGKDFDFESLLKKAPSDTETVESLLKMSVIGDETFETSTEQPETAEITELEGGSYRTECAFLADSAAVRESATDQRIEATFSQEMVDEQVLEQDRSTDFVFTEDTPPMLPKRQRTKKRVPSDSQNKPAPSVSAG